MSENRQAVKRHWLILIISGGVLFTFFIIFVSLPFNQIQLIWVDYLGLQFLAGELGWITPLVYSFGIITIVGAIFWYRSSKTRHARVSKVIVFVGLVCEFIAMIAHFVSFSNYLAEIASGLPVAMVQMLITEEITGLGMGFFAIINTVLGAFLGIRHKKV